jgi:hypothetical protein
VPEASLPCTPEEQAWWKELREAGNELRASYRSADKQKKRFLSALLDATAKYREFVSATIRLVMHFNLY